jgi:hypothetical protein
VSERGGAAAIRADARRSGDWSRPAAQGCQAAEDQLQLNGWSAKRRVVIVMAVRW